jgi:3-deoxy-D-manno-octulosonic-acid transferase
MVNARLSEKSAHGYARFALVRDLLQQALQSVRVVAAQSAADAERFSALGANAVVVTGNIKFDVILDPALVLAGERGRAAQLERRVLLCASTREGEETLLLSAYLQIFDAAARRDTLLVIVPRHPQRFDQVADDITRVALRVSRRSQAGPDLTEVLSCEVLLGDSMGEMATYYAFSDVVIIGGSFLPLGGQNLIEACSLGKPVIMGPSTYNFADAVRLARDAGALLQGADAVAAMRTAHCLLQDGNSRTKMSVAGRRLVDENRGATEKTLELIASVLEKNHSG